MRRVLAVALSLVMAAMTADPLAYTAGAATDSEGGLPESMYLQPPVDTCSECGNPIFEREGEWAGDSRCYTCWALDHNEHSLIQWTPPRPYCAHCGDSTLGNISGYCDACIMAACGAHAQTVVVKDKQTGKPVKEAMVTGGVIQGAVTDEQGTASKSEEHMHLDGNTTLKVTCKGYQGIEEPVSILSLSQTHTVELEKLPDSFTIPIQAVEFAAEAFGPIAVDAAAQLDFRPLPVKIDGLLAKEVTLTRDPESGDYVGNVRLDELAKLVFDGNMSLTGRVTARWDEQNARLELVSSDIQSTFTLSADVGRLFYGVSGELKPQIRLVGEQDEDGSLQLVPQVSCSGSAYAYLGPKLEHTVKFGRFKTKLEAELNGGVEFQLRAEMANGRDIQQDFFQLTGNLRAAVKLLGFERVWEGYHWQYYPVVEEGEYPPPQPVDRFPTRSETGTADPDSQVFHPDARPVQPDGELPPAPVVEDAGSNADPVIVSTGGGGMDASGGYTGTAAMFWLEDASERQDMDRYRLVYAVYEQNRWSDPVPVHDDGTADYAPRALHVGDTTYILWQNADKVFPSVVDSAEYALSMDIYAAVLKDGKIQSVTNLCENVDGYCGMHSLSATGNGVTAAWMANSSGDLLFAQGESVAYEAVFNGQSWGEPVTSASMAAGQQEAVLPVRLMAAAGSTQAQPAGDEGVETAGLRFYTTTGGEVACEVNGREQILISEAPAPSFGTASNGRQVFLYWLYRGGENSSRLDGMFYDVSTGQCSEMKTYMDGEQALHGLDASMDDTGTVLLTYQSSQWQDAHRGTYASTDLMTAAIAPPEWTGTAAWWYWLVLGGVVLVVAVVTAVLIVRKKANRHKSA